MRAHAPITRCELERPCPRSHYFLLNQKWGEECRLTEVFDRFCAERHARFKASGPGGFARFQLSVAVLADRFKSAQV